MEVVVNIPDKFFVRSDNSKRISRKMLEAYAIEEYRQESLSLGQVSELLGLSIDETNAILKRHHVPLNYTFEHLEEDRGAIEKLLNK